MKILYIFTQGVRFYVTIFFGKDKKNSIHVEIEGNIYLTFDDLIMTVEAISRINV